MLRLSRVRGRLLSAGVLSSRITASIHNTLKPSTEPACPPESLAMLGRDPGWGALEEISGHTVAAVAATRRDPGQRVRAAVAGNPACPPRVLMRLAHDPQVVVRAEAAGNPNCPPRVLIRLAGDADTGVRAAAHARTPRQSRR